MAPYELAQRALYQDSLAKLKALADLLVKCDVALDDANKARDALKLTPWGRAKMRPPKSGTV